jgi:CYTH domain-containing protein
MAKEIERKFTVNKDVWDKINKPESTLIHQGYLMNSEETTIRVRYTENKGTITIKGKQHGITRDEYEYAIPLEEAIEIFQNHCPDILIKKRYKIEVGSLTWEVDEYTGKLAGLVIAEVELSSEQQEVDDLPDWIELEVTQDIQFSNAFLATLT